MTTALGAKQEGLTIVHFVNKLIVSCKEAVRFPFYYFFLGGGGYFKTGWLFFIQIKRLFPVIHSVMIIYLSLGMYSIEIHLFC